MPTAPCLVKRQSFYRLAIGRATRAPLVSQVTNPELRPGKPLKVKSAVEPCQRGTGHAHARPHRGRGHRDGDRFEDGQDGRGPEEDREAHIMVVSYVRLLLLKLMR